MPAGTPLLAHANHRYGRGTEAFWKQPAAKTAYIVMTCHPAIAVAATSPSAGPVVHRESALLDVPYSRRELRRTTLEHTTTAWRFGLIHSRNVVSPSSHEPTCAGRSA